MLGYVGVGAHHNTTVVGIVSTRRPDFLPVDDPLVTVFFRFGAKRSQVRTTSRLGEQLTPNFFTTRKLWQKLVEVLGLGIRHKRRRHHALTNDKETGGHIVLTLFLLPDDLLNCGRTAPSVSGVPTDTSPASIVLSLLPELGHF